MQILCMHTSHAARGLGEGFSRVKMEVQLNTVKLFDAQAARIDEVQEAAVDIDHQEQGEHSVIENESAVADRGIDEPPPEGVHMDTTTGIEKLRPFQVHISTKLLKKIGLKLRYDQLRGQLHIYSQPAAILQAE